MCSQVFFGWFGVAWARFRTIFMFLFFDCFLVPGITRTGRAQKKNRKIFLELPARPAGPEYGISVLRVLLSSGSGHPPAGPVAGSWHQCPIVVR